MDVTRLILAANDGDREALDELVPLVYEELRWLAHSQLRREFGPRTLSTTALVNEAYLKLAGQPRIPATNRRFFFAVAAQAMRQILIGEARRRGAAKRGGGSQHLDLDATDVAVDEVSAELLSLDQALTRLEAEDSRLARVVEFRFFGGLSIEETAEMVELSARTVKRDWRVARAWLFREMNQASSDPNPA